MKAAFTLILLSTFFLIASCESFSDTKSTPDQPKQLVIPNVGSKRLETPKQAQDKIERKEELFETECTTADIYLTHKLSIFPIYKKNHFKVTGVKLTFNIFNAASITAFHNFKFSVKFLSESGAIVKEEIFTITETLEPSKAMIHTINTNISNQDYNAFSSTELEILGADCKKGKEQ